MVIASAGMACESSPSGTEPSRAICSRRSERVASMHQAQLDALPDAAGSVGASHPHRRALVALQRVGAELEDRAPRVQGLLLQLSSQVLNYHL